MCLFACLFACVPLPRWNRQCLAFGSMRSAVPPRCAKGSHMRRPPIPNQRHRTSRRAAAAHECRHRARRKPALAAAPTAQPHCTRCARRLGPAQLDGGGLLPVRHGTPVLRHTKQKQPLLRVHAGRAVELRLLAHPPGAADAIGRWAAQHGCALCGPDQSEGARLQPLQPLHVRELSAAAVGVRAQAQAQAQAVCTCGSSRCCPSRSTCAGCGSATSSPTRCSSHRTRPRVQLASNVHAAMQRTRGHARPPAMRLIQYGGTSSVSPRTRQPTHSQMRRPRARACVWVAVHRLRHLVCLLYAASHVVSCMPRATLRVGCHAARCLLDATCHGLIAPVQAIAGWRLSMRSLRACRCSPWPARLS